MDKKKWGLKRQCHKCGAFFYDMNKLLFADECCWLWHLGFIVHFAHFTL